MARGESGRIVLEIDPAEKDSLYAALTKDGLTLKEWFLRRASEYLHKQAQRTLLAASTMSAARPPERFGRKAERSGAKAPNANRDKTKSS
jgi:hypothetical protein